MSKRRWIWITLSLVLAAILGVMATNYNAKVLAQHRARILPDYHQATVTITLGSIGFGASILGIMIFLARLLREMKLNQVQSEYIARVSHELKTPLSTIELTSGLLRTQELDGTPPEPEERTRLWKSHEEELDRLKRQVHSLLEAARWQVNPPRISLSPIRLKDWISAHQARWAEILGPGSSVEVCGDPMDFEIKADPEKLELIFLNLVENARKFAKVPGPMLRIRCLNREPGAWALEIEDSGWGFPRELSRKLFRRFYRAPHGAPYAIEGTGLGLHLSHTAALAMGLKLSARSEGVGRGATFTIEGRVEGRSGGRA
jgi:signal transduction histidine kinase